MKNILFLLTAISTMSCTSCTKKDQVDPVTPAPTCSDNLCPMPAPSASSSTDKPKDNSVKFQNDDWQFSVPSDEWAKVPVNEEGVQLVLRNPNKNNLIVFIKEKFEGSTEQYVLLAIRGLKEAGGTFVSAKNNEVNGNKFVLVESSKQSPNTRIWMSITTKSGNGYALTCGGPVPENQDDAQKTLCSQIISTLKIK